MAVIAPTVTPIQELGENAHVISWTFTEADTCTEIAMGGSAVRSVQIAGTFGGSTVLVQGSNDGTNYATLTDPQGTAISKSTAAIEQIEEVTRFVKPSASGGTAQSVTVTLFLVKRGR